MQGVVLPTTDAPGCGESPAAEESSGTEDEDEEMEFSVKDEEGSMVSDTDYIPPSERGGYNTANAPKTSNLTVKVTRFTAAAEEGILPPFLPFIRTPLISIV